MSEYSERLRAEWQAVKLSFTKFGVRRAVKGASKDQMAHAVSADPDDVSAAKRLIDTKAEQHRNVSRVFSQAKNLWSQYTLPYPEPGIRLLKRSALGDFQTLMDGYVKQLTEAVEALNSVYPELREAARARLGDLYDPNDYPADLLGAFEIRWEFPSVDPPEYLKNENERIWQQERERANARLNEAVQMAEAAFAEEFRDLLGKLVDRMTPDQNGQAKRFGDGVVNNLAGFFERFDFLNVGSNAELESLIQRAKSVIEGKDADDLRNNANLRQEIRQQMAEIGKTVEGMLVDAPVRSFLWDEEG